MHRQNSRQYVHGRWLINIPWRQVHPAGRFEVYDQEALVSHGWFPDLEAAKIYVHEQLHPLCGWGAGGPVNGCENEAAQDGSEYEDLCVSHAALVYQSEKDDV